MRIILLTTHHRLGKSLENPRLAILRETVASSLFLTLAWGREPPYSFAVNS